MHRPARHPLHEALGSFLEKYPWSHFHTLTFARESGEEYARREWRRYLRLVQLSAGVPLQWFFGIEHGERFGRVHVHALTGNTERLPRSLIAEHWRAGFSRILDYEPGKGASHYLAKYVTKEMSEWDISDATAASSVAGFRTPVFKESQRLAMRERARAIARARLGSSTPARPLSSPLTLSITADDQTEKQAAAS